MAELHRPGFIASFCALLFGSLAAAVVDFLLRPLSWILDLVEPRLEAAAMVDLGAIRAVVPASQSPVVRFKAFLAKASRHRLWNGHGFTLDDSLRVA